MLPSGKDATNGACGSWISHQPHQSRALSLYNKKKYQFHKMAEVQKNERVRRVEEATKALNLSEYLDGRPGQLSGGNDNG